MSMSYFGVYIPPTKVGFEGSTAQWAGSIAAENIKTIPDADLAGGAASASSADDFSAGKYEDPDYPPDSPLWLIFTEKSKALDILRHYKEARLREFPNREQAESYVQFGFESIEALKRFGKSKTPSKPIALSNSSYKSSTDSPYSSSPTGSGSGFDSSSLASMSSPLLSSSPTYSPSGGLTNIGGILSNGRQHHQQLQQQPEVSASGERPPFRAPTKQELVEFRKQIEAGNLERVKRIVWENPRFLISSGDTPTSLKEGCRYNAMHICAQVNQAQIAELLLKIISDREFTQLYAGKKGSGEMCAALNVNLLDYYLNMPDKARGETPLHFAVKNGHVAMVEVLTAYPQCKSLVNHEGKEPKDIICLRAPHASIEVIKKCELLMYDPHYVPVLRSVANELPPQVGKPFTPDDPPNLQLKTDECEGLSVDLTISALAGPMPREKAMNFYRRWKTPPRVGSNVMSPLTNSPFSSPVKVTPSKSIFNRSGNSSLVNSSTPAGRRMLFSPGAAKSSPKLPLQNGNGNDLENNNNNVKRVGSLVLPSTPVRLMKFMSYRETVESPSLGDDSLMEDLSLNLSASFSVSTLNNSFRERHIKNSDIEKGLEVVGRQLAHQEQFEWREFWDFLDSFVDIATPDGLARLEAYFAAKAEQTKVEKSDMAFNFSQLNQYLDLVSSGDQHHLLRQGRSSAAGAASGGGAGVMTPYTCVEKSLQVFAKRITKTLINKIGNMVSINDTLLCELKRLKSLIVSFKDDARFISVDFGKVHSRIAHLVASYVANSQEVNLAMNLQLLQMLRKLCHLLTEERGREQHLGCVCGSLLQVLEQLMLGQAPAAAVQLPDALKTEELCSAAWESQQSCACLWDANLSRKTSRRKRTESMHAAAHAQSQDSGAAMRISLSVGPGSGLASGSPAVAVVPPGAKWAWRPTQSQNSDDEEEDSEEDGFFFDCNESLRGMSSSEEDDAFRTPPQSPLPRSVEMEPRYELFIFGKEPTKRDLDVLNAISIANVEQGTLPHVYAWKMTMENFSAKEMDLFPSPKNVQKTHKPAFWYSGFPNKENSGSAGGGNPSGQSMVRPKRLFGTPKLNDVVSGGRRGSGPSSAPSTPPKPARLPRTPAPPTASAITNGLASELPGTGTATASPTPTLALASSAAFQTPLNKMRGLFSKYREPRPEIELNMSIFDSSRMEDGNDSGSG